MALFPMGQDDNNLMYTAVTNYIYNLYNPDNYNIIIGGPYLKLNVGQSTERWDFVYLVQPKNVAIYGVISDSATGKFTVTTTNNNWAGGGSVGVRIRTNVQYGSSTNVNTATSWFNNNAISSLATTEYSYLTNFDLYTNTTPPQKVIKLTEETTPDGDYFEITNCWTHGIWYTDTQPQVSEIHYRNFRAKMTGGKFALYPIANITDGKLLMGIKNDATFYDMEYSTDGRTWTSTDTFPFTFFYRKRINELGEFDYALTFSNSIIPEFADETTATGYINGTVDITQADNWDEISNNYDIFNGTGISDDTTTMGQVFLHSLFTQQYICSQTALQQIANAFYDTSQGGVIGMFENIKKGLEMYGENVVESIINCTWYPINLATVFTNITPLSYIYFGGYKFDLQDGVTVNKIVSPSGYYDFGSFELKPTFKNIRDYSPFSRLFAYLPYVGWVELDIARYINKTVSVRYYFDTSSGGLCMACLFANDLLVDYFQGQAGVGIPLRATDYTAYASAQLQTLLGGGKTPNGNQDPITSAGVGFGEGLSSAGLGVAGGVAGLGVAGSVGFSKTLYGLTQNNINNFNKTKGGSTPMLNCYLPQEVCFMLEIQDAEMTPNEIALQGYPTNASGQLQSFSGYLEVDAVNLQCGIATDEERNEILKFLQNGIII